MKHIYSFIVILFVTASLFGQQQIPNSSFENWTQSGSTLELDSWFSVNTLTPSYPNYGTLRTTDAYDGTYALKLRSGQILIPGMFNDTTALLALGSFPSFEEGPKFGIPFTSKPISCSFYFKYTPGTYPAGIVDTALFYLKLNKNGHSMANAEWIYYGNAVSEWTKVNLTLNYYSDETPDTIYVNFVSSLSGISQFSDSHEPDIPNVIGNELLIDKLELNYNSGLDDNLSLLNKINVYPNPASDFITINNETLNSDILFSVYDIMGRCISSEKLGSNFTYNTKNLNSGVYIIEFKSNQASKQEKLIIQK